MFLKKIDKKDRKGNNKYVQYRLCESYRIDGKPRQRTIFNVGRLDGLDGPELKMLADRIEKILHGQLDIFDAFPAHIERYAQETVKKIIESKSIDLSVGDKGKLVKEADYEEVDLNTIENHDIRELGAEWITMQAMDKLGAREMLGSMGYNKREVDIAYLSWISRTINPLSELGTEKWLKRSSSLFELLGLEPKKINRFHLYEASRKLYQNKVQIEKCLSEQTNEMFGLEDKVILYDLTNSYFEGRMLCSKKAKFGRSKEKRTDAKIVALALVTNSYGFLKYSKIYDGNIADCKTMETTIDELVHVAPSNGTKPKVVIDAGIATEENLKMLREKGYSYLCVSRATLKEYENVSGDVLTIYDRNKKPIELKKVKQKKNTDTYLYVRSEAKQQKEDSIEEKLSQRFEEGLEAIKESLGKNRGIKTVEKVYERIGRLKSKYPRVSKRFVIKTEQEKNKVSRIDWTVKDMKDNHGEKGVYFLRANDNHFSEQQIWDTYNTIREIESTFRCLKTELNIRPNYHQTDENIEPHINLGLLAYQVVSVIRHQLSAKGIKDSWSTLVSKMNTQKATTTAMIAKNGNKIFIRNCSVPNAELREIYQHLNLKPVPFYKKRCVTPTNE